MIDKKIIMSESISYVEKFGIDVRNDPFPWFILSILFGARISESIAVRTFYLLKSENLISPEEIIKRGWDDIEYILDFGGYTRYDFKTATKLINVSRNVIQRGGFKNIMEKYENTESLVKELKSLSKGIGDITIGIFMREIVDIWKNAKPIPSNYVKIAMENLNLKTDDYKKIGVKYSYYEYFLHKIGKKCLKKLCRSCPVNEFCKNKQNV